MSHETHESLRDQPSGFDGGDDKIDLTNPPHEEEKLTFRGVLFRLRWPAYIMEFIGAFYLTLVVAMTATNPQQPLAIGAALCALIFTGGHVSGGHFNPAVTLSVFLRQKATLVDSVIYIFVQFIGGLVGSFCAWMISPINSNFLGPGVGQDVHIFQAFFAEFLFSFYLCSCVLNVATVKSKKNNHFYGLAIGFTVLGAAYSGSRISGAALNQAVAVGRLIIKSIIETDATVLQDIWIYLIAPWIGSLFAAVVFFITNWDELREIINEYKQLGWKTYFKKQLF